MITSNGGQTWTEINQTVVENLIMEIQYISENVISFVTDNGEIFRSSNGGQTWTLQESGRVISNGLISISFVDEWLGYGAGWEGVLNTTNGGVAFTKEPLTGGETEEISLFPNFPNPIADITQLHYNLKKPGRTELRVFNAQGQGVFQSDRDYEEAGEHILSFRGGHLPSGIYHFHLSFEGKIKTGKMVLIK
jgi:hypothetical protein